MDSKKKSIAKYMSNDVLLKKGSVDFENEERKVGMAAKDRIMVIRQKVQAEKKISVVDLSRICNVTEETIRRDLDKLETEGVVTRVHGGAIWNEGTQKEGVHFYRRMSKHLKEKQEIARKATVLFEGKNTIVADSLSLKEHNSCGGIETASEFNGYYSCDELNRNIPRISTISNQFHFYRWRV
ncbi:MAG: DeoR family transcriptional regulator [Mediterraneibacter faecis]